MTLGERIRLVRENTSDGKLSMAKFADRLGVTSGAVSQWENGQKTPSTSILNLICEKFNVSITWLKDEIGEMYLPKDEADEIAEITAKMFHESDPLRMKLAKLVFELDEEDMKALKKIWAKVKEIEGH